MADMNSRVMLTMLLDFYGPLLTEHRQELMRLYCEEDLTQQEIAVQLEITRQGVSDGILKSKQKLEAYESKLGLVARYRAQMADVEQCMAALRRMTPSEADRPALNEAMDALTRVLKDQ